MSKYCLLYTSDAADEEDSVDLGGRRKHAYQQLLALSNQALSGEHFYKLLALWKLHPLKYFWLFH